MRAMDLSRLGLGEGAEEECHERDKHIFLQQVSTSLRLEGGRGRECVYVCKKERERKSVVSVGTRYQVTIGYSHSWRSF